MFNGKGKVHYDDKEGFRVTLEVEQGLANYYYSFQKVVVVGNRAGRHTSRL